MDKAFFVFRDIEKRAGQNRFQPKTRGSPSLTYRTQVSPSPLGESLKPLWNLSRPRQVFLKKIGFLLFPLLELPP